MVAIKRGRFHGIKQNLFGLKFILEVLVPQEIIRPKIFFSGNKLTYSGKKNISAICMAATEAVFTELSRIFWA
jgi:hypothetical protein